MKDKFSMYSSRFKKLSKEEYKIYFSHSYKILKEFLSKIFVNIKNMSQMDLFNILKYPLAELIQCIFNFTNGSVV